MAPTVSGSGVTEVPALLEVRILQAITSLWTKCDAGVMAGCHWDIRGSVSGTLQGRGHLREEQWSRQMAERVAVSWVPVLRVLQTQLWIGIAFMIMLFECI